MDTTESGFDRTRRAATRFAASPRLLVFPSVAAIGCGVALTTVFVGVRPAIGTLVARYGATGVSRYGVVALLILISYTLCALVITSSNGALVRASAQAIRGESVDVRETTVAVWQHKRQLLVFELITGLIGSVLGILERRVEFASKLTVAILGAGYTVFSFCLVPAVVLDDPTTSEMATRSIELLEFVH